MVKQNGVHFLLSVFIYITALYIFLIKNVLQLFLVTPINVSGK